MTVIAHTGLSAPRRKVIMRAGVTSTAFASLCLLADCAFAQQRPQEKGDDLDVTMQIIVDPDAKLPDEVVRRIPLPVRTPTEPARADPGKTPAKPDAAVSELERANEAREHGREISEAAQERARDATEQRDAARREAAEKRRRDRDPPDDPGRPGRPPRR